MVPPLAIAGAWHVAADRPDRPRLPAALSGSRGFRSVGIGHRIVAGAHRALPAATLRHLLLDQVLPLALGRMGRMAIHASAVHVPGLGAVAFAGGPGSGKSTLAAALARAGCAVLSDDCLVIAVRSGGVWAIPSYPGVRLWPDAASRLGYRGRLVAHYSDKVRVATGGLPSGDCPARLRALFLRRPPRRASAPCPCRRAVRWRRSSG